MHSTLADSVVLSAHSDQRAKALQNLVDFSHQKDWLLVYGIVDLDNAVVKNFVAVAAVVIDLEYAAVLNVVHYLGRVDSKIEIIF